MKILVSNDDGIYSPGIRALAELASELGDVRIVAPDSEMSSVAHAITATRPLRVQRTQIGDFDAYRVNGTPADCVAIGAHGWDRVDLVLSGINMGLNLGNGMWHSGTLAAARQAALLGIRGIALSAPAPDEGAAERNTITSGNFTMTASPAAAGFPPSAIQNRLFASTSRTW